MRPPAFRLAQIRASNPHHYVGCPCTDCVWWRRVEALFQEIEGLSEELAEKVSTDA